MGAEVVLVGYEDEENLGIRSIAAFLEKNGISVRILPCQQTGKEKMLEEIQKEQPKIVGFSLIFQRMFFRFAGLMTYLRKNGVTAHFTVGGHFPTLEYAGILERVPELDTVVRHEGEETLLELYRQVDHPGRWHLIPGLAYRENGLVQASRPRPLISDLDRLPFPLRTEPFPSVRGIRACSILASRGCLYNCSFCSIHSFYHDAPGKKRRTRSPGNVVEEMAELYSRGVRVFTFKDDDLGMQTDQQKSWVSDFARELKKRKFSKDILWRISCRIDDVDPGFLEPLQDVGLQTVYLGIESGSERGLATANKKYHVADIYRAIHVLDGIGMEYEYGFMLFDPYSTFETVRENIRMLEFLGRNGDTHIRFTKMFPYVGTSIEKQLRESGRLKGTIASPDYEYTDPRLNLLEVIVSQIFHSLLFGDDGLGKLLNHAHFEIKLFRKFFPDHDISAYGNTVRMLTKRCNCSVIETLDKATGFMETKTYEEILWSWGLLGILKDQELACQESVRDELITAAASLPGDCFPAGDTPTVTGVSREQFIG
jgi:anaerobic magnesium-protoporphyrin IX monomethyl ester cyclase